MTPETLYEAWVYLAASPLLGLTTTLVVYLVCDWFYQRSGRWPGLNPVMVSIVVLVIVLKTTDTPYETYFEGAQFIHFLLGPATVALAYPLYRQLPKLKAFWGFILGGILVGGLGSALSGVWIAELLGASDTTLLSLAPKSVTTPVGMGIAEKIGGLPSLTAGLVVITGVIGAVIGPSLFKLLRIRSDIAKGIAMGTASHGIGTARALQLSEEMGAFSGLAMALSALITTFTLPVVLQYLGYF